VIFGAQLGDGGIGDDFVPLSQGELAGDEGGAVAVAIIEDFQELAVECARYTGDAQVIDDEERSASQPFEQRE